jgi:hypothetical protein
MQDGFAEDPLARKEVERLAMEAVIAAERSLGRSPRDVSAAKVGYDIESRCPNSGAPPFHRGQGPRRGGDTP